MSMKILSKGAKLIRRFASQFRLDPNFVDNYQQVQPNFGFDGLGKVVYYRSYSRLKEDGSNENWVDTVQRVVEGTFSLQKEWTESNDLAWDEEMASGKAELMFDKIFNFKFLPSGRGLYAMGTSLTSEKRLFAALNSCAFVSTEDMKQDPANPFTFLFDMSMLGVGVGFDTQGAGTVNIAGPDKSTVEVYEIEDSREGWSGSIRALLDSYFLGTAEVEFDYSKIRPAGSKLRHFGGTAAGHGPLKALHEDIIDLLEKGLGEPLNTVHICDIMNMIGKCVIAGNIRRTAEIALCDSESPEFDDFLDLKNYEKNPERMSYGWTSNNSVFAKLGMDYSEIVKRIVDNGEPGLAWLENMQDYSRMDVPDYKDHLVRGGNPCLEQSLESYELCCLVETFPNHHESLEEFKETLECAFLYGKSVTLGEIHWEETNDVMAKNRRIGTSMSGIVQFISNNGLGEMKKWCQEGYDHIAAVDESLSDWLDVPKSIKTTSVKPSGTLSLVAGATPGIHHPESKFYIRRLRITKQSELLEPMRKAGYFMEEDVTNPSAVVVDFPVALKEKNMKTNGEVSIWEKMELTAFFQKYWADNQVSCTVTFDKETESDQVERVLNYYQYHLKGISFLPVTSDYDIFPQMPYEEITEEEYNEMIQGIGFLELQDLENEKAEEEKFCSNDSCTL